MLFAFIESRHKQPLLPFRILQNRNRAAAYVTMALVPAAMFAMFFFLSQVLQNVMAESPMKTGLMFLPFSAVMIVAAAVVSRLVQKVNPGYLAAAGATIGAIAVFGFSRMPYDATLPGLGADIDYVTHILPFILIMPIGMALVFIPTTMSVLHAVNNRDSGIASGVLNTMQQVGGALGVATLGTIAYHATTNQVTSLCGQLGLARGEVRPVARRRPLLRDVHPRRDDRVLLVLGHAARSVRWCRCSSTGSGTRTWRAGTAREPVVAAH